MPRGRRDGGVQLGVIDARLQGARGLVVDHALVAQGGELVALGVDGEQHEAPMARGDVRELVPPLRVGGVQREAGVVVGQQALRELALLGAS